MLSHKLAQRHILERLFGIDANFELELPCKVPENGITYQVNSLENGVALKRTGVVFASALE